MSARTLRHQQRDLAKEAEATKLILIHLADIGESDDEQLRADTIEGETDFATIMTRLVQEDGEDEALLAANKKYIDVLEARNKRIEQRIELRRAIMANGLDTAGLPSFVTPAGTPYLADTARKVIVTDESAIPSSYFDKGEPTLNKKRLGEDLKNDIAITGAALSNGGKRFAIKRT